jgi:hypothetical protein
MFLTQVNFRTMLSFTHSNLIRMNGDTESAMYAIMAYIYNCFQSGKPLSSIEADCRVYLQQMDHLKRYKAKRQTNVIFQATLNLLGKSPDPCVLTGFAMDQEEMTRICTAERDRTTLGMMQGLKMQLLTIFGRYEEGSNFAISVGNKLADQIPGSTMTAVDPFFRAVSLYEMAGKNSHKTRKYLHHAIKAHTVLSTYVKKGNPNLHHMKQLLDAKKASLNPKKFHIAMSNFEGAAVMASRAGFLHDAALINERFSVFLLNCMKDEENAAFRMHQAIRLYHEWGVS